MFLGPGFSEQVIVRQIIAEMLLSILFTNETECCKLNIHHVLLCTVHYVHWARPNGLLPFLRAFLLCQSHSKFLVPNRKLIFLYLSRFQIKTRAIFQNFFWRKEKKKVLQDAQKKKKEKENCEHQSHIFFENQVPNKHRAVTLRSPELKIFALFKLKL